MDTTAGDPTAQNAGALRSIVALLRPGQWTKNAFVLAGFIFARRWTEGALLADALLAFAAFCAASSAAYVFNDWRDREADRTHPVKRRRPFASGALSVRAAWVAGIGLAGTALALGYLASLPVVIVLVAYFSINVLYSMHLKHHVIVDVFAVSSGFMLRLLAGTWAIGIPPSSWMLLTAMFLTLFLAFAKRRAEWADSKDTAERNRRRSVMNDYSAQLLDTFLAVTATAAILSYGLYTVDPGIQRLHGTTHLVYTVPFVTFAVFRYLYLVHLRGQGEDPSRDLFADRQLLACAFVWVVVTVSLIN